MAYKLLSAIFSYFLLSFETKFEINKRKPSFLVKSPISTKNTRGRAYFCLDAPKKNLNFATQTENNHHIMTYLNRFHQESVERCLKKIAESKSLQMNYEEEVQKIREMHRQIAQRYPKEA